MTKEQGKPLKESIGEVNCANGFVAWYAEEGKRIYGETIPASHPNKRIFVHKQPVGVIAAITPWNFPAGKRAYLIDRGIHYKQRFLLFTKLSP